MWIGATLEEVASWGTGRTSQAALVGASSRGREVPSQTAGGSHTLPYPPTPITTPGSPSSPWPQWLSPSCLYRPMTSISLPLMLIVCLLMIDPMRPWTSSQSPVPSRVRAGHGVVTMLLLGTSFQPPIRGFLPLALPSPPRPQSRLLPAGQQRQSWVQLSNTF